VGCGEASPQSKRQKSLRLSAPELPVVIQPKRGGQGFSGSNQTRKTGRSHRTPEATQLAALEQQAFQHIQNNRHHEACRIYELLIRQGSRSHLVYYNAALIKNNQGKQQDAIPLLQKALEIKPDHPNSHLVLGNVLQRMGNLEPAIEHYQTALQLNPELAQAHQNLGVAFHARREFEQALSCFERALTIQPGDADALFKRGNALIELGRINDAIQAYEQAAAQGSQQAMLFNNLGNARRELGLLEASLAAFQTALRLDPGLPEAHWNASLTLLLQGNYTEGWEQYEWRFRKTAHPTQPHATPPNGTWCERIPSDAQHVVVVTEQGLGDTLQFMRYVPNLRSQGLTVDFCAQPKLHGLIQASGIHPCPLTPEQAREQGEAPWIPLLSLPYHLGVSPEQPRVHGTYISTCEALIESWRLKLTPSRQLLIGINWQGDPETERLEYMSGRSLPLECLAPLAEVNTIRLVSLQKGFGSEQLEACSFRHRFVDCQEEVNNSWDFLDCAAVIAHCDLIITSDTAVAHLAGGMGKPTWLLLKAVPDWRWGITSDHTFWYPSMRLFRQRGPGQWEDLIQRVCGQLNEAIHSGFQPAGAGC